MGNHQRSFRLNQSLLNRVGKLTTFNSPRVPSIARFPRKQFNARPLATKLFDQFSENLRFATVFRTSVQHNLTLPEVKQRKGSPGGHRRRRQNELTCWLGKGRRHALAAYYLASRICLNPNVCNASIV